MLDKKTESTSREANPTSPIGNAALLRGLAFQDHTSARPVLTTLKDCRCSVVDTIRCRKWIRTIDARVNHPPLYILSYTAYRYRVIYYSHRIKPVPVAGRKAHIHLCLVSVVRSSTSGPLVASDTDSSHAPSSQPSSLQFVAVGIRRPRRQSYVVFQYVKELISFHSFVEGGGVEPPAHPKLFRESPPLW